MLYVAGNCNSVIMGNVGIGTSTNLTSNLNVNGSTFITGIASFSNAIIQSNATTPNYFMGNVGIGTINIENYKVNINGSLNINSLYSNNNLIDFNNLSSNLLYYSPDYINYKYEYLKTTLYNKILFLNQYPVYYNSINNILTYDTFNIPPFLPSGTNFVYMTNLNYVQYNNNGILFVKDNTNVDILIVGGGGGGGADNSSSGGGGGGGEVKYISNVIFKANTYYNIVIGTGGNGKSRGSDGNGNNGNASYISDINNIILYSANGGLGGGPVYGGNSGNGYLGSGVYNIYFSGGGGGSGGNANGPTGGIGVTNSITGTQLFLGGGGGGGGSQVNNASYGGGRGAYYKNNNAFAANGTPNTGGGGGGGGMRETRDDFGGNGGSGLIIIKSIIKSSNTFYNINSPYNYLFTDNYIINNYYGKWFIIKLNFKIFLNNLIIYNSIINEAPSTWKLYGSNDGIIYYEINLGHNLSSLTTASYSSGFYTKNINNTSSFLYYGMVINSIIGGNSSKDVSFTKIEFNGSRYNNNILITDTKIDLNDGLLTTGGIISGELIVNNNTILNSNLAIQGSSYHFGIASFSNSIYQSNITTSNIFMGNVGIGTTNPTSIFQVGNAGRLRIANGSNDFSLIGTLDTDNNTSNTKIFLNGIGNTSANAPGSIQYFATGTGSHNWYSNNLLIMELKTGGELLVANDIVGFNTFSDINLKTNIKPLNINCIDLINKINPVEFTWKNIDDIIINKRNKKDYGFIAQEIELLIPSLIYDIKYKSKYKLIKYDKFAPYFVKAIQELHKIIQQQQIEIEKLKTEINNIKLILANNNLS
jgi:hypothetical protein